MPKFNLTAEYDQTLRDFAARLPMPEANQNRPMWGHEILTQHPGMRLIGGGPIDRHKLYFIGTDTSAVDHYERLKEAYLKGGQKAVVQYLVPYIEFIRPTDDEERAQAKETV